MINNLLIVLLISIHFITNSSGQTSTMELVAFVKKASQSISAQKEDKFFSLNYVQTTIPWDNTLNAQKLEVSIKKQNTKSAFESDYVDYFSDEEEAYVVYKNPKKIFVFTGNNGKGQMSVDQMNLALTELWDNSILVELKSNNPEQKRISITPKKSFREIHQIEKLILEVDIKTVEMKRLSIYFIESLPQKMMIYNYKKIDRVSPISLPKKAKFQVMDSGNKLLKKYKGFSIERK